MKAVNLIPADARRGGGGGGGDAAVYGLLGGLAVVLAAVALFVLTGNDINQKTSDLAKAKQDSATAAAHLAVLKPYEDFAALEQSRVSTVKQLAASRFNWYRTMGDLSRVVGKNVWLTSMTGTVAAGVDVQGGTSGGAADSFRSQEPGPAVVVNGCAVSNQEVVKFVSRLRAMRNVTRVTLAEAQKSDAANATASSGGASSSSSDCGTDHWPQFDLVVFYKDLPTPAAPTTADSAATTTSTTTTTPTSSGG